MEKKEREKLIELQMLDQEIRQLDEQISLVEQQYQESLILLNSLDELKEQKDDSEILAPIASGIFVKAKVLDKQNLILNIGANIMVEKTIDEAKEIIEKQVKEFESTRDEMLAQIQESIQKAKNIQINLKRN